MRNNNAPLFLVVDLFCGFGGTTMGYEMTEGIAKVIACVNHDAKAIKSHWLNHPDVEHFEEDMRTLDLTRLTEIVSHYRRLYPGAYVVLWASLECTNFSRAKGGLPRDADSRTLADHLERYVIALNPDYIKIENVVEFMSWGPLRIKAKAIHADRTDLYIAWNKATGEMRYGWEPLSKKRGQDWLRWRKEMCALGYYDEWKEMNSANFGAYTSRNRLFGVFARPGLPVIWPTPTHSKKASHYSMLESMQQWKAVKEVLDFKDHGKSIFGRKKPLSEKSLERVYAGLIKEVAGGKKSFIAKYYSGRPAGKITSVESPAGTIACAGGQALIQTAFLANYYSSGGELGSIEAPAGTITTKDRISIVQAEHFLLQTSYGNAGSSIEKPSPPLLASRRHHYLINPSWGGCISSVENPCPVIVARQDKAPMHLVATETGQLAIEIYETDSPATRKIKAFMAAYGIVDIKMRMLKVSELLQIQGFPIDYQMHGTQTDRKKFIGNSVVPVVVKSWALALSESLSRNKYKVA